MRARIIILLLLLLLGLAGAWVWRGLPPSVAVATAMVMGRCRIPAYRGRFSRWHSGQGGDSGNTDCEGVPAKNVPPVCPREKCAPGMVPNWTLTH